MAGQTYRELKRKKQIGNPQPGNPQPMANYPYPPQNPGNKIIAINFE